MKFEWMNKKLLDIAEINPKEKLPKGTVAKKIAMDVLQPFTRDISSFEYAAYSGGSKFRNGDTIMARITPCLENGKTAQVRMLDKDEVGFGSTEYIVFRAKKNVDPDFLYYLICSPFIREPAIQSMVGSSGRQRVQTDVVANVELPVPSYEEQKKVGKVLKVIDDKILLNNQINKNLEAQAMAIYKHMITSAIDSSWSNGILSDVAQVTMGQSPKGETLNQDGKGSVFFQGRAEFGFRFPTRRLYTTDPKRKAKTGDVLISVRAPVGDLNIAYEDCCIGRGLGAIRSNDGHQSYILYTMFTLRGQLDVYNGQGTVFGSINQDALKSLKIHIPPKQIIDQFEKIVSPIDSAIRNRYEENRRLETIRNSLLPRLMSGEISTSNIEI